MGDHSILCAFLINNVAPATIPHHRLLIWNGKLICKFLTDQIDLCENETEKLHFAIHFINPSSLFYRSYINTAGRVEFAKNRGDAYYLSTWLSSYKCAHKVTVSFFWYNAMMMKKWDLCGSECRKKCGKCFSLKALLLRDAV